MSRGYPIGPAACTPPHRAVGPARAYSRSMVNQWERRCLPIEVEPVSLHRGTRGRPSRRGAGREGLVRRVLARLRARARRRP